MKSIVTSPEMCAKVTEMINLCSIHEIAEKLKVSESTVSRIIKASGIMRNRASGFSIRSRIRKDLIKAERRRALFGFDQRTKIKVFTNRECAKLKYCLKRRKYRFLKRGDKTAYFDANTLRDPAYEQKGIKLGLKFQSLESQIS